MLTCKNVFPDLLLWHRKPLFQKCTYTLVQNEILKLKPTIPWLALEEVRKFATN